MRDVVRYELLKKGFEEYIHHGYNNCWYICIYEENEFQDLNFKPTGYKMYTIESTEDWLYLILTN